MPSGKKTERPCNAAGAGHRKRLKERFKKTSLEGFHDYEIIELLLTYAIPRRDVKPVAKEILKRFGDLKGVFEAPIEELGSIPGIGESASVLLGLVRGISEAYLNDEITGAGVIRSPEDAVSLLRQSTGGAKTEALFALYMNSQSEVLGMETLHLGTLDDAGFTPRTAIEKAFQHNARSIIICHSLAENKDATNADRRLAIELENAAAAIDIIIHDYIILHEKKHVSAREQGWLKRR